MSPTVSIIVPVYNAENTLRRCVDSILNQEYTDFELILVNDGSKDLSGEICDEYAAKDSRVKVVHKENSGVSDSRNIALDMAQGTYLQFLDADDWITPNATHLFVEMAKQHQCDMVISDFYRVVGERMSQKGTIEEGGLLTLEEFAAEMMKNPADFYYGVLWNKFFRRDIVEKYRLRMDSEISWCEDFMFNLEYLRHCENIYVLQAPIYYYVKTKGSLASQGMSIKKTIKMKLMVFEYYNDFYKNVLTEEDYEKNRRQVYHFLVDAASDGAVPPAFLERRPVRRRKRVVYTVTFNPSLDYIVSVKDFALGKTNRTSEEQMLAGGKGINVSTVLKNLDVPNVALGFTAGFTGKEIVRMARKSGIRCSFITLEEGVSRINVKMKDFEGTEINGKGPVISKEAVEKLMEQLKRLRAGDILVLAGSIPESMDNSIYREIMSELSGKGIEFVVDATKDLLLNVLEYHPFLIKPNNHELGEIFGVELTTREQVVPYAKKLQEMGARNVLVSMAGEGAVLLGERQQIFMLPAPKGKVANAVGAGDSMVAGFLAGWIEKQDSYHAFKMGVAAGSASAFSEALATKEEIQRVYNSIM